MLIDEYQAAVRSSDTRRVMWTLTSLAIRIAQAMGLHHENTSSSLKPFAREMRRRLWWQLCLLDSHAASDRASNPVISADSFSTKLPLGINDEDFHIDSLVVEEQDSFTAMTFPLICYEIFDIVRQLNFVPARDLGQPQHGYQENFPQRIDAVVRLQQRIQERYLRHLNLSRPFHWTTRVIADIITASMWLIVYRPLQKRPGSIPSSQIADPGILRLSVEILEKAYQLDTDPAASPYRWISQTYVQWHALAVTTAELCVKTEGPLVERAWVILQPIFELASQHVADSSEGMLWRPVKKLMCRAERVRQEYLSSGSAKVDSSATVTDGSLPDQGSYQTITEDLMVGTARHEQEALAGYVPHMEGLQQTSYVPTSVPFDWGPWLATASIPMETPVQTQFNDDLDQMSWNNWEDFVNDFQG